jgi:hypothetical protein
MRRETSPNALAYSAWDMTPRCRSGRSNSRERGPGRTDVSARRIAGAGHQHRQNARARTRSWGGERLSVEFALETGTDVLHAAVETAWVVGCSDESEPFVEAHGRVVDGVDHDEASGRGLAGGDRFAQRLRE